MSPSKEAKCETRTPWEMGDGWEYDLLRLLSPTRASEVWSYALRRGFRRMLATWWVWPLMTVASSLLTVCMIAIWMVSAVLGLGWLGRVVAEMVFHLALGYVLHPYIARTLPRLLRPFVREELLRVVEEEAIPAQRREHE